MHLVYRADSREENKEKDRVYFTLSTLPCLIFCLIRSFSISLKQLISLIVQSFISTSVSILFYFSQSYFRPHFVQYTYLHKNGLRLCIYKMLLVPNFPIHEAPNFLLLRKKLQLYVIQQKRFLTKHGNIW